MVLRIMMNVASLPIVIVFLLISLCACETVKQGNTSMHIVRGLVPAITQYNALEQTLIKKVSERLSANGYPVKQLTRVYLKNRINNNSEFYAENKIVFIINPAIFKPADFINPVESITLSWEDPSVIYTPDGGMEFEVGRKINPEDLVLTLYGLQDTYPYQAAVENQDIILNRINEIFLACKSEDIRHLTSKGLPELLVNHQIIIIENADRNSEYKVIIRKIGLETFDKRHFSEDVDIEYSLNVDLNTASLSVLEIFYPGFYPTPSSLPITVPEKLP
jgi:hypothetical protein